MRKGSADLPTNAIRQMMREKRIYSSFTRDPDWPIAFEDQQVQQQAEGIKKSFISF
jgi:hypothetical protein